MAYIFVSKYLLKYENSGLDVVAVGESNKYYTASVLPQELVDVMIRPRMESSNTASDANKGITNDVEVSAEDNNLIVKLRRKLENGLDLKPITVALAEKTDPEHINDLWRGLVTSWVELKAEREQLADENQLQNQIIESMVQEKEKHQELILNKVAALIDERNAQISKHTQ